MLICIIGNKFLIKIKSNLETQRISHVPEGKYIRYEKDEKKYLPKKLWFDHNWNEIGEKRFREAKYFRLDSSRPSPTIVTSNRMYYHPTENRYLTAREAASLQSFPANFEFIGSNSSLVAPITLEKNSIVGAGSVITKKVKKNSLALTRNSQAEIKNYKRKIK